LALSSLRVVALRLLQSNPLNRRLLLLLLLLL
jgi:hypothetical protein